MLLHDTSVRMHAEWCTQSDKKNNKWYRLDRLKVMAPLVMIQVGEWAV